MDAANVKSLAGKIRSLVSTGASPSVTKDIDDLAAAIEAEAGGPPSPKAVSQGTVRPPEAVTDVEPTPEPAEPEVEDTGEPEADTGALTPDLDEEEETP